MIRDNSAYFFVELPQQAKVFTLVSQVSHYSQSVSNFLNNQYLYQAVYSVGHTINTKSGNLTLTVLHSLTHLLKAWRLFYGT